MASTAFSLNGKWPWASGLAWFCLACSWRGLFWRGVTWRGVVCGARYWLGSAWCGSVRFGLTRLGLWCDRVFLWLLVCVMTVVLGGLTVAWQPSKTQ